MSLKLFQSLLCESIAGHSYLILDTAVDCQKRAFKLFKVFDALIICSYLSVPIVWLVLLLNARDTLNPKTGDEKLTIWMRDNEKGLAPLRFLFSVYLPRYFYWEPFEM